MTITVDSTNLLIGSGSIRFTQLREAPEAMKQFVELITNPDLKAKASFKGVHISVFMSPINAFDLSAPILGQIAWYPK